LRRILVIGVIVAGVWVWRDWSEGPSIEENTVLVLDLRRELLAGPESEALAGLCDPELNVAAVRELVVRASRDPRVSGLLVRCSRAPADIGNVQELRAILGEFRRANKPVVAFAEGPDTLGYLVASAANEVLLDASSPAHVTGLEISTVFLRELLGRYGVEADLVRVGEYKAGFEQWNARESSPAFRESMESLADSLFDEVVGLISRSRGVPEMRVRQLIDDAPLRPEAAKRDGLVDGVIYRGDLEEVIADRFGDDVRLLEAEIFREADDPEPAPARIALIHIVGLIVEGETSQLPVLGRAVGAEEIVRTIRQAEEDPSVEGILLRIDSPGGVLSAAETVWHQIARTARVKSVVASIGASATSGAYYLACGAHEIVAQPTSLAGGVGVFGGKIVVEKLLRERGIHVETFRRGRRAGFLDPTGRFDLEERRALEERMDRDYKRFVRRLAEARGLEFADADRLARGRVWTGRQAFERGLADDLGGLSTAMARLAALLDRGSTEPLRWVEFPRRAGLWDTLTGDAARDLVRRASSSEGGFVELEIRAWTRSASFLDGRSALALMPIWLQIE